MKNLATKNQEFVVHRDPYTIINNSMIRDFDSISDSAYRLLTFMLMLPENWDFSTKGLEKVINTNEKGEYEQIPGWSLSSIKRYLNNLENAGYLIRRRVRNTDGTLGRTIFHVFSSPQKVTSSEPQPKSELWNDAGETQKVTSSEPQPKSELWNDAGETQKVTSSEPQPKSEPLNKYINNKLSSNNYDIYNYAKKTENASSEDILPVQVAENVEQYDFFAQPTFEQVCKYAESRKIKLNEYQLVDFFNYYERLGWTTQDQVTRAKSPCHWGRKLLNWETKNLELRNAIHQQNEIAEERLNNQEPNCVDAPKTKKTQEVGTIHFNIPSRSQVETFIKDNKLLDVDTKAFLAYYDERHWVDAGGKRITNWQDKCKKWQKRHNERQLTKTVEKVVLPELSHPTIEDIRKYVKDNKLKFVEPERFFRYYENKAWSGVQNWKNVLESWDSKGKDRAEAQTKQAQASDSWQKKKTQEKNLQQAELLENTLYLIRDEKEKENTLLEIKRLRAEA